MIAVIRLTKDASSADILPLKSVSGKCKLIISPYAFPVMVYTSGSDESSIST